MKGYMFEIIYFFLCVLYLPFYLLNVIGSTFVCALYIPIAFFDNDYDLKATAKRLCEVYVEFIAIHSTPFQRYI